MFERLEPCAGKLARTVPRGRGHRKMTLLPDYIAFVKPVRYRMDPDGTLR